MNSTSNYGLNLPTYDDYADIEAINENSSIIDDIMKQNADKILINEDKIEIINKQAQNYTTHINDPKNVADMIKVARSYYDVRGSSAPYLYQYGQTTALDDAYFNTGANKRYIDCSTLVGLVLRGIDFDHSPYSYLKTGSHQYDTPVDINREKRWAIDPYKYYTVKDVNDNELSKVRTASQLAEMFARLGYEVDYAPDFSNIEAGDIVFYSRKNSDGSWTQPDRYRKISHVAIVASKRAPDAGSAYPYKHTMYEATTGDKVILNRTLEETLVDTVTMFARPNLTQKGINSASFKLASLGSAANLNDVFEDGFYLLSSSITQGLPTGINKGLYQQLKVESTYNDIGNTYAIVQTLINANTCEMYVRTQYVFNNPTGLPQNDQWKSWKKITMT